MITITREELKKLAEHHEQCGCPGCVALAGNDFCYTHQWNPAYVVYQLFVNCCVCKQRMAVTLLIHKANSTAEIDKGLAWAREHAIHGGDCEEKKPLIATAWNAMMTGQRALENKLRNEHREATRW